MKNLTLVLVLLLSSLSSFAESNSKTKYQFKCGPENFIVHEDMTITTDDSGSQGEFKKFETPATTPPYVTYQGTLSGKIATFTRLNVGLDVSESVLAGHEGTIILDGQTLSCLTPAQSGPTPYLPAVSGGN